jgi:hypothetical protein
VTKRTPTAKALDFAAARKLLDRRSTKPPAKADPAQTLDARSGGPKSKPDPDQTLIDDEGRGQSGLKLPWKSTNDKLPSLTIALDGRR